MIREIKAMMTQDGDFLRLMLSAVIEEFLEAEMTDSAGEEPDEERLDSQNGYCTRSLDTRVGRLKLRVPQTRNRRLSTEIFERYRRNEEELVAALTEMYIQGISTRKVKAISEGLCGHSLSAGAISEISKKLEERLGRFVRGELDRDYPYLVLEARYEKVRKNGASRSLAALVAFGIDWEGRRQVLGMEIADRESGTSWRNFLLHLKWRGLRGVVFAVGEDHPGLKRAIAEVLPEAC